MQSHGSHEYFEDGFVSSLIKTTRDLSSEITSVPVFYGGYKGFGKILLREYCPGRGKIDSPAGKRL